MILSFSVMHLQKYAQGSNNVKKCCIFPLYQFKLFDLTPFDFTVVECNYTFIRKSKANWYGWNSQHKYGKSSIFKTNSSIRLIYVLLFDFFFSKYLSFHIIEHFISLCMSFFLTLNSCFPRVVCNATNVLMVSCKQL